MENEDLTPCLIDIGNTNVHFAVSKKRKIIFRDRVKHTSFILSLPKIVKKYSVSKAVMCSVVPKFSSKAVRALRRSNVKTSECGKDISIPVKNLYKFPSEVGQDRLLNVYAVSRLYKNVRIVVDLGTALTFDFISKRNEYQGGMIFPGVGLSLNSLLNNCALLPGKISLRKTSRLKGKTTGECINSGIVFGYSFLIGGLIKHFRENVTKGDFKVVLTGGDSPLIIKDIAGVDYTDTDLSLKGLNLLAVE